jgi:hypothetical protein
MRPDCSALARFSCGLVLCLASTTHGRAVPDADAAAGPDAAPTSAGVQRQSRFFDPEDGQFDLSSLLENPAGFLPIPIVVTEPAVGYGGGVIGMFIRPREEAGQEGWSRPNISAVGGLATDNGTWAAFAADMSRWLGGRLHTIAGAGTGKVNLDFYGAGLDLPDVNQSVRYTLTFSGAVGQANWQLAKGSKWALGMRYTYAEVDPRLRDAPPLPSLANQASITVSAPTAILEFDSRNNLFTPTKGVYAESSYLISRVALGATNDFERFHQTVLAWQPVSRHVTLGERAEYAWSSPGTPLFFRPYITLRGVPAMRYQGAQIASIEVEARWQVAGRWSVVPFGGVGASRIERRIFAPDRQQVGSGGIGFRYELARKFGLHAGLDLAHSPGITAVYFQVGNAWFRP